MSVKHILLIYILRECAEICLICFIEYNFAFRFGRIGRLVVRIGCKAGINFVSINDPFIDLEYMVNIWTDILYKVLEESY